MIAAIISAVASFALAAFKWIFGQKQQAAAEQVRQDAIEQGRTQANAAAAAQSAATEAAISKAQADSPDSKAALLNLLRGGKA